MLARCEDALREASAVESNDPRLNARVRELVGEECLGLVVATAQLQPKAIAKLGEGLWWATDRALQQASARRVADCKAIWFGDASVFDLCCGIGGDAIAFAERGPVTGVDRDLGLIAMARENARLNSDHANRCRFVRGDVCEFNIPSDAMLHIDPDRREGAARRTRPEDYSPTWAEVETLIDGCLGAAIKVAPAAELPERANRCRVWISLSGSVREQSLLVGEVNERVRSVFSIGDDVDRVALILKNDGGNAVFATTDREPSCDTSGQARECMVDPDAAIRAAGLTVDFANRFGLASIGDPSGFLTGDVAELDGLATCERVLWQGSCDDRKLRKTLRQLNAFPRRVKTRGVSHDANQLERRYRDCGEKPISLWIGRASKRHYAVVTSATED